MKIKPIFFDLDGTLTDSGEGIINCAEETFRFLRLPIPSRQALRFFIGPPLTDAFAHFGVTEQQLPEAIRVFRARYTSVGKYENVPYQGITLLLQQLQTLGYPLYVATSKPESMALDIMDHFSLSSYFQMICGATLDSTRITKTQVLSYLLKKTDVKNPIMVGDTVYDVEGAAALGIPTVGVSWGYGDTFEMLRAGALGIARSPAELFEMLTR